MSAARTTSQESDRPIPVGFITALWLPYALLAWRYWFLCDDAYISFRYARNLARGIGLRFNPDGPPVEGFSNPLWVAVATGFEGLLVSPERGMPAISAAAGAVLIWRVVAVSHRDLGLSRAASLGAGLVLSAAPAMGVWASSGLETMAFAAILFGAFEICLFRAASVARWAGPLALVALVLSRPEGPLWAVAVVGLAAVRHRAESSRWLPGAVAVAGSVVGLELARWALFHDWVPNTVRAKVAISPALVVRGSKYAALYALTFPFHLLALAGLPRSLGREPAVAALALGAGAFAIAVGGDFFPMGRLLVPGLPFLALLGASALEAVHERLDARAVAGIAGLAAAVGGLPAAGIELVPEAIREQLHFRLSDREFLSEHERWDNLVGNTEKFALRGKALAAHTRRGETLVARAIGATGYFSELTIYDQYGLIDPEVASRPLGPGPLERSPGHDREVDAIFFADRDPDYLFARYVRGEGAAIAMDDSLRRWSVPAALRGRYVPDFLAATVPGEIEPGFLFLVRRVRAGEDAEAQWERFERDRRELHRELQR